MKHKTTFLSLSIFLLINIKSFSQDLPLIIAPAKQDTTPMVFFISGDGGWKPFDEKLKNDFNSHQYPFLAINSNKYFFSRKTPIQCANEWSPAIRKYLTAWNRKKIIFIGYSFGGEVAPFVYNCFPDDIKSKIVKMVLLTPSDCSDFEIHLNDMLGFNGKNYPYKVVDEILKITKIPISCIWGDDEKTFFNESNKPQNVSIHLLKGGHHFTDFDDAFQYAH